VRALWLPATSTVWKFSVKYPDWSQNLPLLSRRCHPTWYWNLSVNSLLQNWYIKGSGLHTWRNVIMPSITYILDVDNNPCQWNQRHDLQPKSSLTTAIDTQATIIYVNASEMRLQCYSKHADILICITRLMFLALVSRTRHNTRHPAFLLLKDLIRLVPMFCCFRNTVVFILSWSLNRCCNVRKPGLTWKWKLNANLQARRKIQKRRYL